MSMWEETYLGDHIDLITGFPFKSSHYSQSGSGTKLLRGDNIQQGYFKWDKVKFWENIETLHENYFLKENDIILAMDRPWIEAGLKYAMITKYDLPCLLVQRVACLRAKKTLNQSFLKYVIASKSFTEYVRSIETGTAVPHISGKQIKAYPFIIPPLTIQKAIASLLSTLDEKIDFLHRQNKTMESMAETLFRQWFIEEAQADWELTTLDCHITLAKGLSYKGTGLTTSDNGIPLFNLNSVLEGGGYKSAGLKYYNGDFKERHIIKSGEIIVANTEQGHEYRLIGYPAIIPTTESELSIYTHHLFKICINDDSYLTNSFMYYLLCSKDIHEQVVAATNGSTVNQLSADGLQRPEFKLPPECMVKKFTTQVASFWKKINLNNSQIKNLESLRDTLLPKLLSGEVRVKYAEEEIAAMQE